MSCRRSTILLAGLCLLAVLSAQAESGLSADDLYTVHAPSRDGIGKTYFGREISQVMGHQGAAWLERRTRVVEETPDRVVEGMGLAPDAQVADIGAGTGYFTFRIAEAVPTGRVYAVDVQSEMLEVLHKRIERRAIANATPVLGAEDDPNLPSDSLDAVLLVDAYHEFAYPFEMMQGIRRALRPGGRVFLIEYRGEDPRIPIKPLHKMTQAQAITELEAVGLRWVETLDILPTQHFMVFEEPVEG
ncbi:class I SAM-dependent methyltransferase [Thiocapsa bogorovii]|uniref:class I SAM-dependent methyltransferase n=1 Tax=Thiocapsa bogorovii TaxID=521689 RepID=UPI001E577252|nr:class I SAM-dependent methyltransferase [Thiocapsa bogorovii]UHD15898.1 class I SAM-dependent methyltransferase [Thiocapsa bogorovii]